MGESELLDALVAEKPPVKRYESAEQLEQEGLTKLSQAVGAPRAEGGPGRGRGLPSFRHRGRGEGRQGAQGGRRGRQPGGARGDREDHPRACILEAPRQPARRLYRAPESRPRCSSRPDRMMRRRVPDVDARVSHLPLYSPTQGGIMWWGIGLGAVLWRSSSLSGSASGRSETGTDGCSSFGIFLPVAMDFRRIHATRAGTPQPARGVQSSWS